MIGVEGMGLKLPSVGSQSSTWPPCYIYYKTIENTILIFPAIDQALVELIGLLLHAHTLSS